MILKSKKRLEDASVESLDLREPLSIKSQRNGKPGTLYSYQFPDLKPTSRNNTCLSWSHHPTDGADYDADIAVDRLLQNIMTPILPPDKFEEGRNPGI